MSKITNKQISGIADIRSICSQNRSRCAYCANACRALTNKVAYPNAKKATQMGGLFCILVGLAGFEPTTPSPPVKCATRLRYSPRIA